MRRPTSRFLSRIMLAVALCLLVITLVGMIVTGGNPSMLVAFAGSLLATVFAYLFGSDPVNSVDPRPGTTKALNAV